MTTVTMTTITMTISCTGRTPCWAQLLLFPLSPVEVSVPTLHVCHHCGRVTYSVFTVWVHYHQIVSSYWQQLIYIIYWTHTHSHTYTHSHTLTHTRTHTLTYTHTHTLTHTHTHTHSHTHVHTHSHTLTHTHSHTHSHTLTHTLTHTHTHTLTCVSSLPMRSIHYTWQPIYYYEQLIWW